LIVAYQREASGIALCFVYIQKDVFAWASNGYSAEAVTQPHKITDGLFNIWKMYSFVIDKINTFHKEDKEIRL